MLGRLNCYAIKVGVLLITVALIAGMAGCGDTPSGTEIRDWYDLDAVRDNLGGSYILMNDLDSTTAGYEELASPTANEGKGWQPIGDLYDPSTDPFTGSFNGQGYEIRDLFINRPDKHYVGLFGYVGEVGVIEYIGAVNVTVNGFSSVGGLVGENDGTVSNSYSTGSVTGGSVGGLVGQNDGTVNDSYSASSVTGDYAVGGLVGGNGISSHGTVRNSYSTGNVTGGDHAGGLVGENWGTVSDSYSTSRVTGGEGVGGLVGDNIMGALSSLVKNSYSSGKVTGNTGVGGLVGINDGGTLSDSYSTGSVTGDLGVGGLMGFHVASVVSNSFYNYDEVLINGEHITIIGALFGEDFEEWLANNKFLDINERLSQEDDYFLITDVSDFKQLLAFGQDNSLKFKLTDDLDLAAEPNFFIPYFAGEFDGNGHKISNLSLNFDLVSYVGLFGYLASGGKVTQVGAEDVNITGFHYVGGLVGYNWEGTVSDSYSTGSVTGNYSVGGLVGKAVEGSVSNSYSTGSVTGDSAVGGLMGDNIWDGTVNNSYSTSNVSGNWYVGGLMGFNSGTVSKSYSTGSVTGSWYVGGLMGSSNEDTVSNSFWDTETSGQATSDGGTGKNTTEMQDRVTFLSAGWNIIAVALNETNPAYIWNIVNNFTYPFLSWQPV